MTSTPRQGGGWQGAVLADTYRVLQRLGKGGMGEVYEAEHLRVGKKVAVKFMSGEAVGDRRALERFRREVRALSAITNEHVVSVLDCGELDCETPYIVMERLEGEDLRHLLVKEGPLSVYRSIRFALDACAGLSTVHAAGLVHRDLKPANIFVTRSKTRGELCKILDFGVAKGQTSEATSQGGLLGTVRYMAPEQLSDSASVATTTDVYAVGAILFECLAGRPAHDADTPEELMFDILNRDPPLATEFRSEISRDLANVIVCAMARRQSDRHQSVGELASELKLLLPAKDSDETAFDLSQPVRLHPKERRSPRVSRANALLATALAGGVAIGFLSARLGASAAPEFPQSQPIKVPAPPTEVPKVVATQELVGRPIPAVALPAPSVVSDLVPGNPAARATLAGSGTKRTALSAATPATAAPDTKESRPRAPVILDVKNPYE